MFLLQRYPFKKKNPNTSKRVLNSYPKTYPISSLVRSPICALGLTPSYTPFLPLFVPPLYPQIDPTCHAVCAGRRVGRAWACGRLPAPSGAVRGVHGAAGAMGVEADKAAGWRRASIFLLARRQPCRLRRKPRIAGVWGPRIISQIVPG